MNIKVPGFADMMQVRFDTNTVRIRSRDTPHHEHNVAMPQSQLGDAIQHGFLINGKTEKICHCSIKEDTPEIASVHFRTD